jgi:hypothetical protein
MIKIEATVVVSDVRNFTGVSEEFEKRGSDYFMKFMERYYELHMLIAKEISSEDLYISSTGDGIITIFMGKNHNEEGYAFALSMYRILSRICGSFSKDSGIKLSFGIGVDSGYVQKIDTSSRGIRISTYLGPVINRATRIEALTKEYHYTKMCVGGGLYNALMKKIYPLAAEILTNSDNYDEILESKPELVMKSKDLLIYYIFEQVLKGVEKPIPIFRLARTLANNDFHFWKTMIKLIGKDKCKTILKLDGNDKT